MATFGNKGVNDTRSGTRHRVSMGSPVTGSLRAVERREVAVSRSRQTAEPDGEAEASASREAQYRLWFTISSVIGFAAALLLGAWIIAAIFAGVQIMPLNTMLLVFMVLFLISALISVACGIYRGLYPKGMSAFLQTNSQGVVLGSALGFAFFLLFSEHSLVTMLSEFSIANVLLLGSASPEARQPWSDLMANVVAGGFLVGVLHYWVSKMRDRNDAQ